MDNLILSHIDPIAVCASKLALCDEKSDGGRYSKINVELQCMVCYLITLNVVIQKSKYRALPGTMVSLFPIQIFLIESKNG